MNSLRPLFEAENNHLAIDSFEGIMIDTWAWQQTDSLTTQTVALLALYGPPEPWQYVSWSGPCCRLHGWCPCKCSDHQAENGKSTGWFYVSVGWAENGSPVTTCSRRPPLSLFIVLEGSWRDCFSYSLASWLSQQPKEKEPKEKEPIVMDEDLSASMGEKKRKKKEKKKDRSTEAVLKVWGVFLYLRFVFAFSDILYILCLGFQFDNTDYHRAWTRSQQKTFVVWDFSLEPRLTEDPVGGVICPSPAALSHHFSCCHPGPDRRTQGDLQRPLDPERRSGSLLGSILLWILGLGMVNNSGAVPP